MYLITLSKIHLLVAFALAAHSGLAQITLRDMNPAPDQRRIEVLNNSAELVLKITLDQKVYLPGEFVRINLEVTNPTTRTMEVFDPFNPVGAGVDLAQWRKDRQSETFIWDHYSPHAHSKRLVFWDAPTIFIPAGQAITKESVGSPLSQDLLGGEEAPERSGRYRLEFTFGGINKNRAVAEFQVEAATVVSQASLRAAQRATQTEATLSPDQPLYFHALVLSTGDTNWVVASRYPSGTEKIPVRSDGLLDTEVVRSIGSYQRVGEAVGPVQALRMEADSTGGLRVEWRLANGQTQTGHLTK